MQGRGFQETGKPGKGPRREGECSPALWDCREQEEDRGVSDLVPRNLWAEHRKQKPDIRAPEAVLLANERSSVWG
jgi:hypothetical protein